MPVAALFIPNQVGYPIRNVVHVTCMLHAFSTRLHAYMHLPGSPAYNDIHWREGNLISGIHMSLSASYVGVLFRSMALI